MFEFWWDASNASVITWTYQRLYMSIAYCNELCVNVRKVLQSRGLWEEMKDDYMNYRAELVLYVLIAIRCFAIYLVQFLMRG